MILARRSALAPTPLRPLYNTIATFAFTGTHQHSCCACILPLQDASPNFRRGRKGVGVLDHDQMRPQGHTRRKPQHLTCIWVFSCTLSLNLEIGVIDLPQRPYRRGDRGGQFRVTGFLVNSQRRESRMRTIQEQCKPGLCERNLMPASASLVITSILVSGFRSAVRTKGS
ncbi:hypothetical protein BV25DRAFT_294080 [Artomyces pyxidatus]|uniref:Uncharacterized protein n=1 Tax=Artomyces pyxidatus TaxID=48021 RepID=A0ACB8T5T0_9AGAM|nr:hypothetical protein BV25DRAFT_294080 [Artomyces pyxidatus]